MNTNYEVDAIPILLRENCVPEGYEPLILYKQQLTDRCKAMGCKRKSDCLGLEDEALLSAGLPDMELVGLFRRFLRLYDPDQKRQKEIRKLKKAPEETEALLELMLLPGVDSARAQLYYGAGFRSVAEIAGQKPEEIRKRAKQWAGEQNLSWKIPQIKELRIQIAVANAFVGRAE